MVFKILGEIPGSCMKYSDTLLHQSTSGGVLSVNKQGENIYSAKCSPGEISSNGICQPATPSNCRLYGADGNCEKGHGIGCGSALLGDSNYPLPKDQECVSLNLYYNNPMDPMVVSDSEQLTDRGYNSLMHITNNDTFNHTEYGELSANNGNYFVYGQAYVDPNTKKGKKHCDKYALRNCCHESSVQIQSSIAGLLKHQNYSILSEEDKTQFFNELVKGQMNEINMKNTQLINEYNKKHSTQYTPKNPPPGLTLYPQIDPVKTMNDLNSKISILHKIPIHNLTPEEYRQLQEYEQLATKYMNLSVIPSKLLRGFYYYPYVWVKDEYANVIENSKYWNNQNAYKHHTNSICKATVNNFRSGDIYYPYEGSDPIQ